jgi:hypothetical protein
MRGGWPAERRQRESIRKTLRPAEDVRSDPLQPVAGTRSRFCEISEKLLKSAALKSDDFGYETTTSVLMWRLTNLQPCVRSRGPAK